MSSEEVAEIANAIHSRANELYECWKKMPTGPHPHSHSHPIQEPPSSHAHQHPHTPPQTSSIRKMEDTLELLASTDPGLTPKLEHIVSTFVKRDKAKRQGSIGSSANSNSNINPQVQHHQITVHNHNHNHNHSSPLNVNVNRQTKSASPSPSASNLLNSNGDPINGSSTAPGSNTNSNANAKKNLPKSILAAVQRFESSPERSLGFNINNNSTSTNNSNEMKGKQPKVITIIPVTKNEERSQRNSVKEKTLARHFSPSPEPLEFLSRNTDGRRSPSPSFFHQQHPQPIKRPGGVIERNIPIELSESSTSSSSNSTNTPISPTSSISTADKKTVKEIHHQIKLVDNNGNSKKFSSANNNNNSGSKVIHHTIHHRSTSPRGGESSNEDERFFRSLRSGGGGVDHFDGHHPSRSIYYNSSMDGLRDKSISPPPQQNNNSPRINFAKERIKHSQENPLTQQRLELQKRLPSPSPNLAAAVALQQGRLKFQSPQEPFHLHNHHHHHHLHNNNHDEGHSAGGNRQSWVSTMLKYGNGSSSVADRVQLFEKYPSHIVGHNSPTLLPSGSHSHIIFHGKPSSSPRSESSSPPPTISPTSSYSPTYNHIIQKEPTFTPRKTATPLPSVPWRNSPSADHHHQIKVIPNLRTYTSSQNQSHKPSNRHIPTTTTRRRPPGEQIPKFYHPDGNLAPISKANDTITKAETEFAKCSSSLPVKYAMFGQIISNIGIPLYWKKGLWMALGLNPDESLDQKTFIIFYRRLISECPDDASKFIRILNTASRHFPQNLDENLNSRISLSSSGRKKLSALSSSDVRSLHLVMSDFIPTIQDIIETHPGLGFLREAPEFHSRYVTTVISRIFYKVNRSWSGKISLSELRRSNLLKIIKRLEEENDVNSITEYFSYEHFYVIYCKFWELDKDHDLILDKNDLAFHADSALSSRIIDRIFSGTVLRSWDPVSPVKCPAGKMTYSDFVWFLLSEEDKKTQTAIEYWFRCLDMDGDGILSSYELQYFYSEQESRIVCLGIEPLDFLNVYCMIVDMLHCSPKGIRLKDLKANPHLASNVFNTLFNLDKYLYFEQRDPFASAISMNGGGDNCEEESDWDKYAATEYELLIAEETPGNEPHIDDHLL